MKIGVGGCIHESNTFAPGVTPLEDFRISLTLDNANALDDAKGTNTLLGGVVASSEKLGWTPVPIYYSQAVPSGTVAAEAMDHFLNELEKGLKEVIDTIDGLLLVLHGAMVSENYEDVEGAILKRLRPHMKGKPIAISLDLHANISDDMVKNTDVLNGFDTYPHIDLKETVEEAADHLYNMIKGKIKPTLHMERADLLIIPSSMDTSKTPMKQIMEKAFQYEEDPEVIDVTVAGGFPYSDIDIAGVTVVVTTDNNQEKAEKIAKEMCEFINQDPDLYLPNITPVEEAIKKAQDADTYPVIFVESSDNVGGGGPADATHTLKGLVDHKQDKFLVKLYDPDAVEEAIKLGVGSHFSFEVGGKTDAKENSPILHGDPVAVSGKVKLISDGEIVYKGPHRTGSKGNMGRVVVIELNECKNSVLILTENRVSPRDINQLESLGLNVLDFKIIVVKAAIAWKTVFAEYGDLIDNAIEIDSPGCCSSNLSHFDYENIPDDVKIV